MQILEKKDPLATLKQNLSLMAQTAMADKYKQKQEARDAQTEKAKSIRDIIARGYTRGSLRPKQGKTMQDILMGDQPNLNDVMQVDTSGNIIDTSVPDQTTSIPAGSTSADKAAGNPLISMLMDKMGLGGATQVGMGLGKNKNTQAANSDVQDLARRYYSTDDPDELADLEEQLKAMGVVLQ
jgi:hypothetical protein